MNRYRKYLLVLPGSAILAVAGASNTLAGPGGNYLSADGRNHVPSSQSAQKQSAQNQDQSLHAVITAPAKNTLTDNPCVANTVGVGTGFADGIGDISFEVRGLTLRLRIPSCPLFGSGAPEFVGYDFFTAMNGDQLFGSQDVIRQPDLPDGSSLWSGSFRLSGGTGRFAGAMGGGELSVTFPPGSPTATAVFDGEITLQGTQNDHN